MVYNKHQVHVRKQSLPSFLLFSDPLCLYNRFGPLNKQSSEDTLPWRNRAIILAHRTVTWNLFLVHEQFIFCNRYIFLWKPTAYYEKTPHQSPHLFPPSLCQHCLVLCASVHPSILQSVPLNAATIMSHSVFSLLGKNLLTKACHMCVYTCICVIDIHVHAIFNTYWPNFYSARI